MKYSLFALVTCVPVLVHALPQGEKTVSGNVDFKRTETTLEVSASDKAIIDYTRFDIAAHETVVFKQPHEKASVLNRVNGDAPSLIDGVMNGNGRVFLVNERGVYFGRDAVVNTGSLIVSTLGVSNEAFLKDELVFEASAHSGRIINKGSLFAEDSIALLAPDVISTGSVIAKAGRTLIGAEEKVTLAFEEKGLIQFVSHVPYENGQVAIGFDEVRRVVRSVLNTDEVVVATKIVSDHRGVHLVGGEVEASDVQVTGRSLFLGDVDITAQNEVKLVSNHTIYSDAYITGESVEFVNMAGEAMPFTATQSPIISGGTGRNKGVIFGGYKGPSLKVEALGSIICRGDIEITESGSGLVGRDPDIALLMDAPTLILRAGQESLLHRSNVPIQVGSTKFGQSRNRVGDVNLLGHITTNGGDVILEPGPKGEVMLRSDIEILGPGSINIEGPCDVVKASSMVSTGGNITFEGRLDSRAKVGQPLSVTALNGAVSVLGKIGTRKDLKSLDITANEVVIGSLGRGNKSGVEESAQIVGTSKVVLSGNAYIGPGVEVISDGAIVIASAGNITFDEVVLQSGSIECLKDVVLSVRANDQVFPHLTGKSVTIKGKGAEFASGVSLSGSFFIDAPITLPVGSSEIVADKISLSSKGKIQGERSQLALLAHTMRLDGPLFLETVRLSGDETAFLGASVTLNGGIFTSEMRCEAFDPIKFSGGNFIFEDALLGAQNLTFDLGGFDVTCKGMVDASRLLIKDVKDATFASMNIDSMQQLEGSGHSVFEGISCSGKKGIRLEGNDFTLAGLCKAAGPIVVEQEGVLDIRGAQIKSDKAFVVKGEGSLKGAGFITAQGITLTGPVTGEGAWWLDAQDKTCTLKEMFSGKSLFAKGEFISLDSTDLTGSMHLVADKRVMLNGTLYSTGGFKVEAETAFLRGDGDVFVKCHNGAFETALSGPFILENGTDLQFDSCGMSVDLSHLKTQGRSRITIKAQNADVVMGTYEAGLEGRGNTIGALTIDAKALKLKTSLDVDQIHVVTRGDITSNGTIIVDGAAHFVSQQGSIGSLELPVYVETGGKLSAGGSSLRSDEFFAGSTLGNVVHIDALRPPRRVFFNGVEVFTFEKEVLPKATSTLVKELFLPGTYSENHSVLQLGYATPVVSFGARSHFFVKMPHSSLSHTESQMEHQPSFDL